MKSSGRNQLWAAGAAEEELNTQLTSKTSKQQRESGCDAALPACRRGREAECHFVRRQHARPASLRLPLPLESPLILLRGQLTKHAKAQTHTGAGVVSAAAVGSREEAGGAWRSVPCFFSQNEAEMNELKQVSG